MANISGQEALFQRTIKQARASLKRGWKIIPLRAKSKRPRDAGWPNQRVREDELSSVFSGGANIGVILGKASGGLGDVDLDATEAVRAAKNFLPKTGRIHGRPSKPESHWFYNISEVVVPEKFLDPEDGKVLVEIRFDGQQTAIPPSIHPSGERFRWESTEAPAGVDASVLRSSVRRVAACALVARHWPNEGARHDCSLALSGALLRGGWSVEDAHGFVETVARSAEDEEWRERGDDVASTAKRLSSGATCTGITSLAKFLGVAIVDKFCEWLELSYPGIDVINSKTVPNVLTWPSPPSPEAFYGLAGDIVKLIEPHSEADPVGLLVQTLIAFGSVIGRGPHFRAEGDRHGTNLFAVLVGISSKGRKGSAWSQINRVFESVDCHWSNKCIQSGLSSGEGLIWAVRDPLARRDPVKKAGRVIGYQNVTYDHGVEDKRLLVFESEFASALRVIGREGNTLSAIARLAWDSGNLSILTKNSPAKSTGAHISLIGHITRDELRRYLDSTELGNGFANRHLWVCVKRSKMLPDGGHLEVSSLGSIRRRICEAVEFAQNVQSMKRGKKAAQLWRDIYPALSEGRPGLLGAVTSRAEAQSMRLASVYALMDRSDFIRIEHLQAALSLWKYCEASARYIFGDSIGDQTADELVNALRGSPRGLTRTEIRDHFSKNRSAREIERALTLLEEYGLISKGREVSGGRPTERWSAVSREAA